MKVSELSTINSSGTIIYNMNGKANGIDCIKPLLSGHSTK